MAITIDWEGAYISPEGLDALDEVREVTGGAPITHFVSAGYLTKLAPQRDIANVLRAAIASNDQVALHLHAWESLARVAAIQPRSTPSFLSGTTEVLQFDDDVGFDVDPDAYTVAELRTLLRTSRRLLEDANLPLTPMFRAGGFLATPKLVQALRDEAYTVDSSAIDARQLDERAADVLPDRVAQLWPKIDAITQPFLIATPGPPLLEMPIAAFADYSKAAEIVAIFEAAHARVRAEPTRDGFVVLGFHQETGGDHVDRLVDALRIIQGRKELAAELRFVTLEAAAELARDGLTP